MRRIICCLICGIALSGSLAEPAAAQSPTISGEAVLDHLNQAIRWYLHLARVDTNAGQPSDALYLQNARSLAQQALQLAFKSAEEEALLLQHDQAAAEPSTPGDGAPPGQIPDHQRIAASLARAADRIKQIQLQMAALNKRLSAAHGKTRENLVSQRDALEGKLELEKALRDALAKISSVVNENMKSGLAGKINELKQSVPELASSSPGNNAKAAAPAASKATRANSSGLIGQAAILFSQMGDMRDIQGLMSETRQLRDTAEQVRSPLRDALKTLMHQGREAADKPLSADPAEREAAHRNLDALTVKFKQISAATVPLRQEIIVLDQCHANLLEWRNSIEKEYGQVLRSLLTRVAVILVALAVVFIFSEIWRRATYRYIREARRRRQMSLLRRLVTGFLMVMVIVFGFVSEFSSLATFAGFITAGMAVALQTVILSVAAYFFLIGRYGVRVGDRITVSGVTGEVINIGLVRIHLMELAGTGIDLHPTGRIVVFSNSVLFQTAPLFKQIPGTAYTWHEAGITLAPNTNYALAEKRILEAVNSVYDQYREKIEQQHEGIETQIDVQISTPRPEAQVHFVDSGLEIVVRYPVEIQHASEIDDRITRKLAEAINSEPELKAAVSGAPKLRSAIKG